MLLTSPTTTATTTTTSTKALPPAAVNYVQQEWKGESIESDDLQEILTQFEATAYLKHLNLFHGICGSSTHISNSNNNNNNNNSSNNQNNYKNDNDNHFTHDLHPTQLPINQTKISSTNNFEVTEFPLQQKIKDSNLSFSLTNEKRKLTSFCGGGGNSGFEIKNTNNNKKSKIEDAATQIGSSEFVDPIAEREITKRRESHNATERRRREKINENIDELRKFLPGEGKGANKAEVLHQTAERIRSLQSLFNRLLSDKMNLEQSRNEMSDELYRLRAAVALYQQALSIRDPFTSDLLQQQLSTYVVPISTSVPTSTPISISTPAPTPTPTKQQSPQSLASDLANSQHKIKLGHLETLIPKLSSSANPLIPIPITTPTSTLTPTPRSALPTLGTETSLLSTTPIPINLPHDATQHPTQQHLLTMQSHFQHLMQQSPFCQLQNPHFASSVPQIIQPQLPVAGFVDFRS